MLVVLPLRCCAEPFFTWRWLDLARFALPIRSPRLLRVSGPGRHHIDCSPPRPLYLHP